MVGHVQCADGTKEDSVELLQAFKPAFGNVVAFFQVVVGAPREMLDTQLEAAILPRQGLQHLQTGRDDFRADAIARDGCNLVFTHSVAPLIVFHTPKAAFNRQVCRRLL